MNIVSKKLYILLLLVSLTNNTIGQRLVTVNSLDVFLPTQPFVLYQQSSNSLLHSQNRMRINNSKIISNYSHQVNLQTISQASFIQLYDSIYYWMKEEDTNSLKLYSRSTPFVYDSNLNLTSKLEQLWNGNWWSNSSLYTATFDANSNKKSELHQNWDGSFWWDYEFDTLTYNDQNLPTSSLHKIWNGVTSCVNDKYYSYVYDNNRNKISCTEQNWQGGSWMNYRRLNYIYDANNQETSCIIQNWLNSSWVNGWKYTSAYDANNNRINLLYSLYLGAWADNSLNTYSYDLNNNLIGDLYQEMHGYDWVNNSNKVYTYDVNNNLIEEIFQVWDGSNWKNYQKEIYTYDLNNNPKSYTILNWNGTGWCNYTFHDYKYDDNNLLQSHSSKIWKEDGTLAYRDSTQYYFHTIPSGTDDLNNPIDSILVYPNPATTKLFIKTPNPSSNNTFLILYNINGQKVFERRISELTTEININNLQHGTYLVKLFGKTGVKNFKFIKQ